MPLKDIVTEINQKAALEHWDYPTAFDALKAAGVEGYVMNAKTRSVTYHGLGEKYTSPFGADIPPLVVAGTFDKQGVITAIRRSQKRETTYGQFLAEISKAGVDMYQVDMQSRTVSYLGKKGEEHVEEVPVKK